MTTVHDAELFTVGTDEVVVTFRTDDDRTVTTSVGDHEVATTGRYHSARVRGLEPGATYALAVEGASSGALLPERVTTLEPPPGRLLTTFATANDVHFGETICGSLGAPHEEVGPVFRAEPGERPYPLVMNEGAIAEMRALDPAAVVVKGDLTDRGTDEQYAEFLDAYGVFGARLHHVRGNHDAMTTDTIAATAPFAVPLHGVVLAVLDTVTPGTDRGRITAEQLVWLDDLAASATDPVLVFGHHHPWNPASPERDEHYFGINPDDSEALCAVVDRRPAIAGYFAGHTHRNRVRRFDTARRVPIVEIACVKDYPGAWAEYRVHQGGYAQLVRRVAAPDAMAWTERTRQMFAGLYRDYALGRLGDRCFVERF